LGRQFIIRSDHVSLQFLNLLKDSGAGRLHRWLLRLQQYDYTLIHLRDAHNNVADALSRREYEHSANKTMDDLRQEETVYSIQKQNKEPNIRQSQRDTHRVNTELVCQIGK